MDDRPLTMNIHTHTYTYQHTCECSKFATGRESASQSISLLGFGVNSIPSVGEWKRAPCAQFVRQIYNVCQCVRMRARAPVWCDDTCTFYHVTLGRHIPATAPHCVVAYTFLSHAVGGCKGVCVCAVCAHDSVTARKHGKTHTHTLS